MNELDTKTIYWMMNIAFLAAVVSDYREDRNEMTWRRFLPLGLPLLIVIGLLFQYAAPFWYWFVAHWLDGGHLWHWDDAFRAMPFNDGAIFRIVQPESFTWFMRWIYDYGFIMAWGAALLRSFLAKDALKMIRYTLSSHMLQLPFIVPFYMTILLNEVWFVLGEPDGMARNLAGAELLSTVRNCFPSMHTSVSFAVLLLALRERGRLYKWIMVSYCSLVIYSTLYLTIHWVLDVIGGLALGAFTVMAVDKLMDRAERSASKRRSAGQTVTNVAK
ncbi:phosphatase PAP2 family protein [Paenibacillus methanolicus]|uniref:PAP2 superfamily protein n=1 Tax=Paenibacillus methanolicus TaxID=582686 RepID=A0A5S5CAL5_9BACL|nr:phosphatase PAP2 family protein [Paenibacillus methanolicus]TYP76357.1 PAP2 superfamily protein [Paenibacillus methanolicus]